MPGKVQQPGQTPYVRPIYPTYPVRPSLPLSHLARLRCARPDNLIAVQQTQGIKCPLELPHCIHGTRSQLVLEVVPLDEPHAVLAGRRALELDGALDHVVHEVLGFLILGLLVVEDDS